MDMTSHVVAEIEPTPQSQEHEPAEYPVSIFGKLPDGCVLEEQQLQVLMHWYRKAIAAAERLPADVSDDAMDAACAIVWRLYAAILAANAFNAGNVALKLQAVLMKLDLDKSESIEEVLDVEDIRRLAAELSDAIKLSGPVKKVGVLRRGRKLTCTGSVLSLSIVPHERASNAQL